MAKLTTKEEMRLLSKVGKLYYEEGLTQNEIVDRLQLSRAKISRLLQAARDRGVVQIMVISPPGIYPDLEMQIETRYQLKEAIVVEVTEPESSESVSRELGVAAANYLQRIIREDETLGVSWGTTLSHLAASLQPNNFPEAQVVQLLGGLGAPESEVHATDICRRMARMLGCRLTLMPSPGIVDRQEIKDIILSDSHVQKAFDSFRDLSTVFLGIGAPNDKSVMLTSGTILTQKDLRELLECGAVGDIALRFFDKFGQPVRSELDSRVIGIGLDQLCKVDRVVGVAGGGHKVEAILGALRGKLVNVLITDQVTARRLLEPFGGFNGARGKN